MKILVNRKIKRLFGCALSAIAVFSLLSAAWVGFCFPNAALVVSLSFLGTAISVSAILYRYFREENEILEDAVVRIRDYLSGHRNVRIESDEEGELYRLFHEVNSLAAILNAHAESEARSKTFLKHTISDISHQLKTPLAALNIYNGLMQQEADASPAIREFAALSEQELDRIEALVQSLLKIAKLDAGTIVFEKELQNISEMMSDLERRFSCQAEQEGKHLVFSGDDTMTLLCDRNWLTEAISNLIKNAFDHTKEGDIIRVEWSRCASMVQIAVQDDGSGIHPEDLPHIFKRFYRSRFSEEKQGIGLGLPLAKAIIEAHGGTVEADSDPGTGTVFTVNFLIPTKL